MKTLQIRVNTLIQQIRYYDIEVEDDFNPDCYDDFELWNKINKTDEHVEEETVIDTQIINITEI